MDTKTDAERSRNMAAIKSRNTSPELLLRKSLWGQGVRFFTAEGWKRLSGQLLPGSPDLIFPRARLVVFVDGCFWHGCPEHYRHPDDNMEYWARKLASNTERDQRVNKALQSRGWKVLRYWEHQVRKKNVDRVIEEIRLVLEWGVGQMEAAPGDQSDNSP